MSFPGTLVQIIIKSSKLSGKKMNNSSSQGFKLTTVILAVIIMAIGAMLSGNSAAIDMDEELSSTEELSLQEE